MLNKALVTIPASTSDILIHKFIKPLGVKINFDTLIFTALVIFKDQIQNNFKYLPST